MTAAIKGYLERGGSVLWVNGAVSENNPELGRLFGVKTATKRPEFPPSQE